VALKRRSIGALLTLGVTLAGCETTNPPANVDLATPFSALKAKRAPDPAVLHVFQLLKEERYKEASNFLNEALQSQPKKIAFHILNALTYEKLAEKGEASGTELATIGYQTALNLDPSNVFAITQLGKLTYRDKQYDQAQEHFANALLLKPNDPNLLHEFAASSYYAYDLKAAFAAIQKAEKLNPEDPLIHRSAAMICAAMGDFEAAKKHLAFFQSKVGDSPEVNQVTARLNDWMSVYKNGKVTLAQSDASDSSSSDSGGESGDTSNVAADPSKVAEVSEADNILAKPLPKGEGSDASTDKTADDANAQIILDCYLLEITEFASTSKGNNILENLAVTLNPGSFITYTGKMGGRGVPKTSSSAPLVASTSDAGFNAGNNTGNNSAVLGSAAAAHTPGTVVTTLGSEGSITGQIFTAGLSWAGLTYSLNIANAVENRTELLSRPSLMTFLHKSSVFFSGDELVTGLTGQYGGNLIKYDVGTSIEVTPTSLKGDMVTLNIGIENSNFVSQNQPSLAATVNVNKTRIDTFARMRLGETLMLGGIYVREDNFNKSEFPGLGDIPLLQYFFSQETTGSTRISIAFMLTPRSPDAVKSAVNRAMARETKFPHYQELVARYPDWFNPTPNALPIFRFMSLEPSIYYEFRTGDVVPPSWGWEPTVADKLGELQAFLYY
jgi:general secretion pathway protein D